VGKWKEILVKYFYTPRPDGKRGPWHDDRGSIYTYHGRNGVAIKDKVRGVCTELHLGVFS
jgi:hypothetical protein